jgi:hypothetical protein
MAAKKRPTNGDDPLTRRMVDVLERIEHRLEQTNRRLDDIHEDHIALRAEVQGVRTEVAGLRVEARFDITDHEERLRRLEGAVFKPAAE